MATLAYRFFPQFHRVVNYFIDEFIFRRLDDWVVINFVSFARRRTFMTFKQRVHTDARAFRILTVFLLPTIAFRAAKTERLRRRAISCALVQLSYPGGPASLLFKGRKTQRNFPERLRYNLHFTICFHYAVCPLRTM